jgi:serine/threonine-protein kinase
VTADQWIGTTLAGYRIEAVLGRGGMGVVYRAEHLSLGRKLALKVLPPELAADASFRRRFVNESRLAASIEHPNIIPIYEAGEANGLLFLAMRYVEGPDLGRLLAAAGPLEPWRALALLSQVGEALDAAHASGLVHRDVKPGNVLVAQGVGTRAAEHCYLCDFGLVKPVDGRSDLTLSGPFLGTVAYTAPEQLQGEPLDGRTDVYALGCMTFRCLAGALPFERGSDMAVVEAHLREPPPRLSSRRPELPPALDPVIARAMAKTLPERHPSCAAFMAELRAALGGGAAGAGPVRRETLPLGGLPAPPLPAAEPTTPIAAAAGTVPAWPGPPGDGGGPPTAPAIPAVDGPLLPAPGLPTEVTPPAGIAAAGSHPWTRRLRVQPPRVSAPLLIAFAGVVLIGALGMVGVLLAADGGRKPSATTVLGGDTAVPGSTTGKATPTCVNGWTTPPPGTPQRRQPLEAMRAQLDEKALFTIAEMRQFRGGDGTRRWYVKTRQMGRTPFRARWLVEQDPGGAARVTAVAAADTRGLKSPDWRAFEGDGAPAKYPDLPGTWAGTPHDFVAGGDGRPAGLPSDVRGCLAGT